MQRVSLFQASVRNTVGTEVYDERDHWDDSLEDMWMSALCRILIGIQRYGHGGAVLLCDGRQGLNKKYTIKYHRLADALFRLAVRTIENTSYSDQIYSRYVDRDVDCLPVNLYLDEGVSENDVAEINDEVTGCVRFIASLSRVDGLIWFDSQLRLKAFGVEITVREEPSSTFLALDSEAKKTKQLDLNHYGTRHRSMFRYCNAYPNSIGFVISQDGDVRAITRVGERVIMWENVRIHSVLTARTISK
jgi:hypothetical protein